MPEPAPIVRQLEPMTAAQRAAVARALAAIKAGNPADGPLVKDNTTGFYLPANLLPAREGSQ